MKLEKMKGNDLPSLPPPKKKPSTEEGFLGLKKEGGLRRFCHPSGLGKLGSDWGGVVRMGWELVGLKRVEKRMGEDA